MKADIFIPTSNRVNALRQCLASLSCQTNQNFRLIIGGLEKSEKTEEVLANFSQLEICYFIQKKKGLVEAANEALARTENEIFIRTDDDVFFDREWLANVLKTFNDHPEVGGVTGPTIMSQEGLKSRDLTAYLEKFKDSKNLLLKLIRYLYYDYLYEGKINQVSRFLDSGVFTLGSNYKNCLSLKGLAEVNNLEACNWSARTGIIKKIGGFDKTFRRGLGEYHEADAALRIKQLGYRLVFNPRAKVYHRVETGKIKKARPESFWRIQNFIIFYFRYFRIKSSKQLLKFLTNIALQNGYYFFRFLTTFSFDQLSAMPGTIVGFVRVFFRIKI